MIDRATFFELVEEHDDVARVVRDAVVRMTFFRGVLRVAKAIRLRDSEDLCRLMKDSSAAASALMKMHNEEEDDDDDDDDDSEGGNGMVTPSGKLPPLGSAKSVKKLIRRVEHLESTLVQRIESKIDEKFDVLAALIRNG